MKPIRNKRIFYFLSFTWGIIMTIIGLVAALICYLTGHKAQRWGYCYCFNVGVGWGGISLGFIMIKGIDSGEHTKNHEHGHAIQNCYFGPFMPFLVGIPSAIRYHHRKRLIKKKNVDPYDLPDYDAIWFEKQASEVGYALIKKLHNMEYTEY